MFKAKSLKYLLFAVLSLFFSTVSHADSSKAQTEVEQVQKPLPPPPPPPPPKTYSNHQQANKNSSFSDPELAFFSSAMVYSHNGILGVQELSQACYKDALSVISLKCYIIDIAGLALLQEIELNKSVSQKHYFSRKNIEQRTEFLFTFVIEQKKITPQQKNKVFENIYKLHTEMFRLLNIKKFEPKE